jgi:hypothetical protein
LNTNGAGEWLVGGDGSGWSLIIGFDPRLQATVAMCLGAYDLRKRRVQALLEDLVGVSLGLETIGNLEHATTWGGGRSAATGQAAAGRPSGQSQPS